MPRGLEETYNMCKAAPQFEPLSKVTHKYYAQIPIVFLVRGLEISIIQLAIFNGTMEQRITVIPRTGILSPYPRNVELLRENISSRPWKTGKQHYSHKSITLIS